MLCIIIQRQMHIKPTTKYYYTPIRIAKIKKIVKTPNANEDAKKLNHLYTTGGNLNW